MLELGLGDRSRAIAQVQEAYYAPSYDRISDRAVEGFLRKLISASTLHSFRIAVVGSSLYAPWRRRDIDLVLRPQCQSARPTVREIERALLVCVWLGRCHGNIKVDPVYRAVDLDSLLPNHCLDPDVLIRGIRLENPAITFRMAADMAPDTRPIGLLSVVQEGPAADMPFYRKLPRHPRTRASLLAPSLSVEDFMRRLKARTLSSR